MPDFVQSALAFIVVLGVLVFFHELGHYLAARWRGVRVEVFPSDLAGDSSSARSCRDGLELAWLPLGGYVKLHGQERPGPPLPDEETPQDRGTHVPGEDSRLARLVVAAGPIANFVLAGDPVRSALATAGRPVILPIAGDVVANSAAARASLGA